jgi:hypothetical protein
MKTKPRHVSVLWWIVPLALAWAFIIYTIYTLIKGD